MPGPPRLILCPYCGNTQHEPEDRCAGCGGFFDPMSIKITQQHMGPWFVRSRHQPFRPGCSYEVLVREIEKGKIHPTTIIRGPTTRQMWSVARHVPGVAHRLGFCHVCQVKVDVSSERCTSCGAVFFSPTLRDQLGLAPAGAEVAVGPNKLTETGSYPAQDDPIGKPDRDERLQLGVLARAFDSDEVGPDVMPVIAATAMARADRDAMTWIAGRDAQEPDTLTSVPTIDEGAGGNGWAWMLITLNVIVLICLVVAIVVVIQSAGQTRRSLPTAEEASPTVTEVVVSTSAAPAEEAKVVESVRVEVQQASTEAGWVAGYESALKFEEAGELGAAMAALQTVKTEVPEESRNQIEESIGRVQTKLNRSELERLFGE